MHDEPPHIQRLIDALGMRYLEGESGYYALRQSSAFRIEVDDEELPAHSSIYYLLTQRYPINYLHWLASEDIHILVDGGPLDYYLFLESGDVAHVRLGRDLSNGEIPAVTVPARSYKAILLPEHVEYALLVNVLTPAWAPDRVRVGAGVEFMNSFVGRAEWATERFLHRLLP